MEQLDSDLSKVIPLLDDNDWKTKVDISFKIISGLRDIHKLKIWAFRFKTS